MDKLFYIPFKVLEPPNIQIKNLKWLQPPSAMEMILLILLAHLLAIGGILYDMRTSICIGTIKDDIGHRRAVVVLPKCININIGATIEKLTKSFLFSLAGMLFYILDLKYNPHNSNRQFFVSVALLCILYSFFTTWLYNRIMYNDCQ